MIDIQITLLDIISVVGWLCSIGLYLAHRYSYKLPKVAKDELNKVGEDEIKNLIDEAEEFAKTTDKRSWVANELVERTKMPKFIANLLVEFVFSKVKVKL